MVNSKQKGSRRERELAQICRDNGFDESRRTQQNCGNTGDASDVVGLPNIHIEVKGTQVTTINKFMNQAKNDSKEDNNKPVVFYKRNNEEWLVVMTIDDWFEFYKEWLNRKDNRRNN
jgi:Holliday junction resolvase